MKNNDLKQDRIELQGLRILTIIGILEHERQIAQPLEFNIALYVDLAKACANDQLRDTVDYGEICQLIEKIAANHSCLLLESLAGSVAETLLKHPLIEEVEISVKKLRPPVASDLSAAAIVIHRRKETAFQPIEKNVYHQAILALGTNLGNRVNHLRYALSQFSDVKRQSQVFETKPVGGPLGQNAYLNMVILIHTALDPFALHRRCLEIESGAGRERHIRWEARTLDIDLLFYEEIRIESPTLTIPHPRINERGFVLAPLAEVAPEKLPENWEALFIKADIKPLGRLNDLF